MRILAHDVHVRQVLFAPDRPLGRRLSLALDSHTDREDYADQCGNKLALTFHRFARKLLERIAQPGGTSDD